MENVTSSVFDPFSGSVGDSGIYLGALNDNFKDQLLSKVSSLKDELPAGVDSDTCQFFVYDLPDPENLDEFTEGLKTSGDPFCCQDIAATVQENKDVPPDKVLKDIGEDIKEGKKGIGLNYKQDGKQGIKVAPQHQKLFDGKLQIKHLDKQSGQIKTKTFEQGDFTVTLFTADQYARITNAATRSLGSLSATLKAHQEKMKQAEKSGKYPLSDRVSVEKESAGEKANAQMKDQTKYFLALQKKKESREKQLRQEKQYREERDKIKRSTKQKDEKFEKTQDKIKRDDIKKADEKRVE